MKRWQIVAHPVDKSLPMSPWVVRKFWFRTSAELEAVFMNNVAAPGGLVYFTVERRIENVVTL